MLHNFCCALRLLPELRFASGEHCLLHDQLSSNRSFPGPAFDEMPRKRTSDQLELGEVAWAKPPEFRGVQGVEKSDGCRDDHES